MKTRSLIPVAAGILVPAIIVGIFLASSVLGTSAAILLVLAGWQFGGLGVVAYFAIAVGLFLGLIALSNTENRFAFPWISLAAVLVGAGACTCYTAAGWQLGMKYQGDFSVYTAVWLNALTAVALGFLLARSARGRESRRRVIFHWVLIL